MLEEILPDLKKLGFDIQPFGQNTFVVHGTPVESINQDEQALIEMMLESYKASYGNDAISKVERLAQSMAKGVTNIPYKKLDVREMKMIIEDLFACEEPNYTVNGKKTFVTISLNEIDQKFINN